jgi:hypothetical protein
LLFLVLYYRKGKEKNLDSISIAALNILLFYDDENIYLDLAKRTSKDALIFDRKSLEKNNN